MVPKEVFIIAEAGVNHNGNPALATELVHAAFEAGADAVKFQTFTSAMLAASHASKAPYQTLATGPDDFQRAMLEKLELPRQDFHTLAQEARRQGLEFMSTAFDGESLSFLVEDIGISRIKVSSGDLTNLPFLWAAARHDLPLIISTGMATLNEIDLAIRTIMHARSNSRPPASRSELLNQAWIPLSTQVLVEPLTVLHCTTEYPTPLVDANVKAMHELRDTFGFPVGYSDHTQGYAASLAAVALGATVIEKHLTLDRSLPGPDHQASLDPAQFRELVRGIREVELALGDGKKAPTAAELRNASAARRSLVASQHIRQGEEVTPATVATKRPGDGVGPEWYWDVLGKRATRKYAPDEALEWILE